MTRLLFAFTFLFLGTHLAIADQSEKKSAIPKDVTYKIISDEKMKHVKRSVSILLNRRVSKGILQTIVDEVKRADKASYERTFVTFYLPEMEVGAGAWATAYSNPNLKIEILGSTEEEYAALQKQHTATPGREIIGTWYEEAAYISRKLILFRQNGTLLMESIFKDGSSMVQELIEKPSSLGRRLEEKGGFSFGEFYIIDKDGDLEMRDSDGVIGTARKMASK